MTHPRLNFGSRAEQIDRRALEFHEIERAVLAHDLDLS